MIPTKATYAPGEPIELEGATGTVRLIHLDRVVTTADAVEGRAVFPPQEEGGYGVESDDGSTAVDVLADPLSRARYGFVSEYAPGRDVDGVAENVRRLHLNAVQFYDWMYRHADLLPPQDVFADALGREVSLESVKRLVSAVRGAGSLPLGYAAVYAAGAAEWPEWEDAGLFHPDGTPWMLGDFLWNVDPGSKRWRTHFADDLRRSVAEAGFAGFHLDQYGAPKVALGADGAEVDLAERFPALIDHLAGELPEVRLIFNNVNDFPTWSTANADQAAIYIEVWEPHARLNDIAQLADKAHLYAPGRSVILAAYLSVFAKSDQQSALEAQRLLLATAFAHGATVLLHGEGNSVLTEAYYVRHGELEPATVEATRLYYDFAVRYGDLLFDRTAVDLTRTHLGGVNEEVKIDAWVPVSLESEPGKLWVRVARLESGLLVSLVNLAAQSDDLWDAPKQPAASGVVTLTLERRAADAPRFLFADPERPALVELESSSDGRYDTVALPAFGAWSIVWIPS